MTTSHSTGSLTVTKQAVAMRVLRSAMLALAVTAATAAAAHATTITISTDATWLAKNAAPGTGWNTDTAFNTATDGGWVAASVNGPNCHPNQNCIWYDGTNSTTEQAYFRKTFFLDGPALSGTLIGGVDDDARIWINGVLVYNVFDGLATTFGPINIAPYLVAGQNLIAVFADDNLAFGNQHTLHALVTVQTATAVPEPATWLLLGSGLAILAARARRRKAA